jgi:pimeloyl-ACP methyl ester carboxylesterase/DNA-binding CsgD family transcriptional regulator
MISMLKNNVTTTDTSHIESAQDQADEANLIHLIYRFAGKKDEWFNLLLSLSKCIAINESLPPGHPYQGMSERLLTHLKNAIKISGRLNSGAYTLLNNNILDQLPVAAGVMDSRGRLVEINRLALNKISSLPQWSICNQQLHLDHLDICAEIQALLQSGDSFRSIPAYSDKAPANVEHLPGTGKDRVFISQIPNPENPDKPYFYFCFEQNRARLISPEVLRGEFKLTETEALVVLTLIEEVSSAKVAKKLKLKDATLRGHLSSIYQKMGVSRKPELIRKVMLHCLSQATQNTHFFACASEQESSQLLATDRQHSQLKSLRLNDGRNLSYLDICYQGEHETQETIIVLHNLMGSAFELPPAAYSLLKNKKIRVLVPERPGYGNSDSHPNRTHQDWCKDITMLLDELGINKVKLIAHSIGGAYALAMAEFMPERLERIAMVNAVTRVQDMLESKPVPILISAIHQGLRFAPFLIEPILKMAVGKNIEHFYAQQLNFMRPTKEGRAADINLLSQPDYRHYSINNIKQSAKQGIKIWADELKLSFVDWPFKITNKQLEYQFWHGDEDDVISIHAAMRLAKELNTQHFYRLKYETHFLFSRHINEVIEQLVYPDSHISTANFQAMAI